MKQINATQIFRAFVWIICAIYVLFVSYFTYIDPTVPNLIKLIAVTTIAYTVRQLVSLL